MQDLSSTPQMVAKVYETMRANLKVVREKLGRPLTLADKALLGHLDDPHSQDMIPGQSHLKVGPDRVILQDVLGQSIWNLLAFGALIVCLDLILFRLLFRRRTAESKADDISDS